MAEDRASRPSPGGYVVVLLGVVCWVVSCFLPLYESDLGGAVSRTTLVEQSTAFEPMGSDIGGLLYLFGGIAAIGVISIIGVRGSRTWPPALLAGAVVAWALSSIGILINIGSSVGRIATDGSVTLGVAYWSCWVSVAVVVAGSTSVVVSARRAGARTRSTAPEMIRYQIPPSAPGGGVAP